MEVSKTIEKYSVVAVVLCIISFGIAWRLVPHFPNFAPIGAIALIAGMTLSWRKSLLVVMATMIVSDLVIGFYTGMYWTWLSFGLIATLGLLMKHRSLAWRIPLGALGASGLFFVVSNFGTWVASGMYSLDLAGLMQCYLMAIPFLRATVLSDIFFVMLSLTAYEVVMRYRSLISVPSLYRLNY